MKRAQAPPKKQPKTNHYMHRQKKKSKNTILKNYGTAREYLLELLFWFVLASVQVW